MTGRGQPWWAHPAAWGLALRVLLMPFVACWDLYGNYWISHQWVYHGVIPLDQYGGAAWIWPPFYLHAGWLWLIRPLIGPGDPWGEGLMPSASLTQFWVGPETIHAFYLHPRIHSVLFLLKCPYLLAEAWLIRLLLDHGAPSAAARRRLAWLLWLNPVSIYVVAVFGGWDVIPAALVVASAILLGRRPLWAAFGIAVATMMKLYPLMLMPFFVLLGARGARQRLRLSAAMAAPVLLWIAAGYGLGLSMHSAVLGAPHYEMLTSSRIALQWHDSLYLFVIGYVLLVCHAARFGEASTAGLARHCAAVLLLFYSLSFFHPQYVFWAVPFLMIAIAQRGDLVWLFAIQAVCLGLYTLQWGPILTTYLLAPLNPDFFIRQPSPYDWLARTMDPERFIGIVHSVFSGASLWMIYEILRRRVKRT